MIEKNDYIKTLLEEQEKLDKEFNFTKEKHKFNVYKIFIGTEVKEGININSLSNIRFTKNFIGRLISPYFSMNTTFINKNILFFVTNIKTANYTYDNLFGLTEITVATSIYSNENHQFIVDGDIPNFIRYYSGVNGCTHWYDKHLHMRLSIDTIEAVTLPCWYADFYRKLIVGETLLENENNKHINKLISNINKEIFTNGDCIRFASLFRFKFSRDAIPLWATKKEDLDNSHVFTYLYGRFYDCNGSYDYNELTKDWIFEYPPIDRSLESSEFNSVLNYTTEYINTDNLRDILNNN